MTYRIKSCACRLTAALIILYLLFSPSTGEAALCKHWSAAQNAGTLDYLQLDEASGIAVSRKIPGRLYQINDSGGGPYFYVSESDGSKTKAVRIEGFNARGSDFEDMSIGKCLSGKSCLFIADTGDNKANRKSVRIIVIEESEKFGSSAAPLKILTLKYPDRPHNAEGVAIHPNGDIYIFTKEEDLDDMKSFPAGLYRLKKEKWENAGGEELTLERMGELNLPRLSGSDSSFKSVVTAFDISPDGKKFIVLTYENAYEFDIDLEATGLKPSDKLVRGKDYSVIELKPLPQQEGVSYIEEGRGFIYDSEYHMFDAPIMKVECLDSR